MGKYKQYEQKFRKEWLSDESLKKWIVPVVANDSKAYCKLCKCQFLTFFSKMFYRGNVQRRKLLKPRSLKKKKHVDQPEWDNTIQDLTRHAASPEEVLRRQLRHKSKNADVARRELVAKKRGIPTDLVLSPGQVELEMKKLAILREVLYDQNDFNEVLKKTDQTMSSVKNLFHDSAFRKSGRPNVTLAPHSKKPPIVSTNEQPSKLDALSDSVMDNKALNEQSSEESEYEDDVQFESKVDYARFMSLLKDSMNNPENKSKADSGAITTPEKGPSANHQPALNCTEEVKRTLSRISSIKDSDETASKNDQTRKIDEVINGIRKDTSKLDKQLNLSKNSITSVRPIPNITLCNMSYEELQGAMANIQSQLKAFETRTGRITSEDPPAPSNGLAGFTVTLIDSVTRLTTYVNEGELRTQVLEKTLDQLSKRFDEQVKVNEALAVELVNTQKVIKQDQSEISALKKELNDRKKINSDLESKVNDLEKTVAQLTKDTRELESKLLISEHTLVESGDTPAGDELENIELIPIQSSETVIGDASSNQFDKKALDLALKNDMVRLLHALKTQNEKTATQKAESPDLVYTGMMEGTQEAAKTIASVESHLRHLQLQHAEAQQRMDELTRHTQARPDSNQPPQGGWNFDVPTSKPSAPSTNSTISGYLPSEFESLATHPHREAPASKPLLQQTNLAPFSGEGSQVSTVPSCPSNLRPGRMQTVSDFPDFDSDLGSFKPLEEDLSEDYQSMTSSVLSSPHMVGHQHAVMSGIQQTQMSLEDRIAELNRQHSQAQERLQKLVARRKHDKLREQPTKKVQISVPSDEMLRTPQVHFNPETA